MGSRGDLCRITSMIFQGVWRCGSGCLGFAALDLLPYAVVERKPRGVNVSPPWTTRNRSLFDLEPLLDRCRRERLIAPLCRGGEVP